ncbi:dimethylaniline monooxygenase [N-oxide-forming] 5-like isoform X1 [Acanthaster planci]|uniref:Flavin-containing monooxygenase n=1 Tax=Acanthaster planci TaxID=133434 RepID=A0A8B7ZEP0_ACAPL|nr:dimethylaniline monooxygenase [N-oxide-forming] 5-like isoform X1 [Acanthaster planci]
MQEKTVARSVAIIGSGVTGLAAIKCCLDEGLQPTCFEKSDTIGGLWVYRDGTDFQMTGSVFKSSVTNTSKEAMCFSDFPFPKQWPNFLRNADMKKYCDLYAEKFGLTEHIRLSTRVTCLSQAPDYNTTGRWVVTSRQQESGDGVTSQVFDSVMICTGMFNNPFRPNFPGLSDFQGRVMHSHDYRKPVGFDDKRVVIIGFGNSAIDAAVDLSRCASQVFLSKRRGAWLVSRRADNGYPYDLMHLRRYRLILSELREMSFKKMLRSRYELINHALQPAGNFRRCNNRVINEELPGSILNGSVVIKAAPEHFTKTGLVFKDGSFEDDIDVVIIATGYSFTLPFKVDCPALETDPRLGRLPLYKLLFPLGLAHNTLSVNGAFELLGPVIPCVELQARWASRVFKGLAKLPPQSEMAAVALETVNGFDVPCVRYVTHVGYADSIASEIGVRPSPFKLFFQDPELALRCMFGPHVPYQYRLVGPGRWAGAREAIKTVWERVLAPTKTRHEDPRERSLSTISALLGIFTLMLVQSLLLIYNFICSF